MSVHWNAGGSQTRPYNLYLQPALNCIPMDLSRLRLDPWPGDYEGAFQIEEFEQSAPDEIDIAAERQEWSAIEAEWMERPEPLVFVDGVRRIEARVLADDDSGRQIHGLFGSIAAGCVFASRSNALFEDIRVRRYVIIGGSEISEPVSLRIGNANLIFEPFHTDDCTPSGPVLGLQQLMRQEEASIAEEHSDSAICVFADGPLTYLTTIHQRTVGVIKRLFQPYISASHFGLVRRLEVGERTPLFAIQDGKYDRYSWYLRIADRRAMDHDVAGVLRLEVRTGVGLESAMELANLSAACLPLFAADTTRDPRAPQNLLPVGSLEQELKHRMGDSTAVRRAIENFLYHHITPSLLDSRL